MIKIEEYKYFYVEIEDDNGKGRVKSPIMTFDGLLNSLKQFHERIEMNQGDGIITIYFKNKSGGFGTPYKKEIEYEKEE